MKLKIVSLMGLFFAFAVTSGNAFAQKCMHFMSLPKSFIILNQETSKKLNLDFETIKSSLKAREDDEIFADLNDDSEIINLGIYDNKEFAGSRVDRDGAGN